MIIETSPFFFWLKNISFFHRDFSSPVFTYLVILNELMNYKLKRKLIDHLIKDTFYSYFIGIIRRKKVLRLEITSLFFFAFNFSLITLHAYIDKSLIVFFFDISICCFFSDVMFIFRLLDNLNLIFSRDICIMTFQIIRFEGFFIRFCCATNINAFSKEISLLQLQ